MEKPALVKYPVITPILKRWSTRAFKKEKVEIDKIYSCLEAARWAASAFNEQPWHVMFGNCFGCKEEQHTWEKILATLLPFNQEWAQNAPILILMVAKDNFSHNNQPNQHAWYDCGQAMAHMALQATNEGLHSHQMAGFDKTLAIEKFKIPTNYSPVSIIAIGNYCDKNNLPAHIKEKELLERSRKNLNQWVFTDTMKDIRQ